MRKSITLCLAGLMLIGLAGCNKAAHNDDVTPNGKEQAAAAGAANNAAAAGAANNAAAAGAANDAAAAGAANGAANAANTANAAAGAAHDVHPGEIPAPADVAAPPADAIKTATGLAYKKLKVNEQGRAIAPTDLVKLHYTGWTTDGHMFDTSTDSPDPVIFTPENLISGMNEAITLAKVGEKVRAWIPQDLAYKGQPGAPAGMLVFDFDIVDVVTPVMPPKNAPEDAVKLPSGVVYKVVKSSPGAKAIDETDLVELDFAGWVQEDGKRFHSSLEMNEPLAAPVNTMFPAWKEVLPKVHVGDQVQIWTPQEHGIDPEGNSLKGTLIFDVKVLSSQAMPQPPADVASPGADTQKTASGIAWRILKKGTGTVHPKATSRVKVHYSGWTTDGVMFDSSVARGTPIEFGLDQVIAGWTEAVQLMVAGEKRLVWIPEELAYKGREGAPAGMLVFEIELIDIVDD